MVTQSKLWFIDPNARIYKIPVWGLSEIVDEKIITHILFEKDSNSDYRSNWCTTEVPVFLERKEQAERVRFYHYRGEINRKNSHLERLIEHEIEAIFISVNLNDLESSEYTKKVLELLKQSPHDQIPIVIFYEDNQTSNNDVSKKMLESMTDNGKIKSICVHGDSFDSIRSAYETVILQLADTHKHESHKRTYNITAQ